MKNTFKMLRLNYLAVSDKVINPLFIVLLLSCTNVSLPAVNYSETLIPGADRIILTGEYSEETFKELAQHLTSKGFVISEANSEIGIISTELKQFSKGLTVFELRISASIFNDKISFVGTTSAGSSEYTVVNKGMSGSPNKLSFDKLDEIVESFPHIAKGFARG